MSSIMNKNKHSFLQSLYVNKLLSFSALLFAINFIFAAPISAQVIYEPIYKDIYEFIDRTKTKELIKIDNLVLPLSRDIIAKNLIVLKKNEHQLTSLEKDELQFYFKEYGSEIKKLLSSKSDSTNSDYSLFGYDNYERFRVFSYEDKKVSLFLNPIFGIEYTNEDGKSSNHVWNGVSFYGSFGENIGFSMDFRDNTISGDFSDSLRQFTPKQGIKSNGRESFQFNIVNAQISYRWNWGSISLGKTPFEWGYAESGKIVHSSKAPSYPNIRLDLQITDWLSFNYLHGWLNSEFIDSNEIYESLRDDPKFDRELFKEKYFASHSLLLKPLKGLSFALGESIIYSDRLELSYLIPVMFFRLADHYHSSHNNDAGNNAQFFFNISSRNHIPNTHLYSTLFIDEIITGEILNSEKAKNQLGYTFGLSIVDLPIKNSNFKIEYSHLNPFAYKHYIPTQIYQNQGYDLGHWIGHNADILHLSYHQRFIRGLSSKIWAQFIRKGEEGDADLMYKIPQPEFLFGLNTKYNYYGIDVQYEFIHDLFLKAKYQYSSIETEIEEDVFKKENYSTFNFALYYGM